MPKYRELMPLAAMALSLLVACSCNKENTTSEEVLGEAGIPMVFRAASPEISTKALTGGTLSYLQQSGFKASAILSTLTGGNASFYINNETATYSSVQNLWTLGRMWPSTDMGKRYDVYACTTDRTFSCGSHTLYMAFDASFYSGSGKTTDFMIAKAINYTVSVGQSPTLSFYHPFPCVSGLTFQMASTNSFRAVIESVTMLCPTGVQYDMQRNGDSSDSLEWVSNTDGQSVSLYSGALTVAASGNTTCTITEQQVLPKTISGGDYKFRVKWHYIDSNGNTIGMSSRDVTSTITGFQCGKKNIVTIILPSFTNGASGGGTGSWTGDTTIDGGGV